MVRSPCLLQANIVCPCAPGRFTVTYACVYLIVTHYNPSEQSLLPI